MKLGKDNKYLNLGLTVLCVILVSVVFYVIFTNLKGFFAVITGAIRVLSPLIYGAVFSYLLNPLVNLIDRHLEPALLKKRMRPDKAHKLSRVIGIVFALVVGGFVVYGVFAMVLPQLYETIASIVTNMPTYFRNVEKWVLNILQDNPEFRDQANTILDKIYDYVDSWLNDGLLTNIQDLMVSVTSSVFAVVKEIFNILIGLVASVYILWSKNLFQAQTKKITVALWKPETANRILEVGRKTHKIFSGFIIGKLLDSLIIGVLCYVGMCILKMPFAMLIATFVGVTNIIPFFGPIIGMVPSALLILMVQPIQAFYFIIFVLVLQQIDGNVIGPRILGDTVGISGFWVLISITVAGNLFGFAGMLLGVPVFAVLYELIRDRVNELLTKKKKPTVTDDYYDIKTVDDVPDTEETADPDQVSLFETPEKQEETVN